MIPCRGRPARRGRSGRPRWRPSPWTGTPPPGRGPRTPPPPPSRRWRAPRPGGCRRGRTAGQPSSLPFSGGGSRSLFLGSWESGRPGGRSNGGRWCGGEGGGRGYKLSGFRATGGRASRRFSLQFPPISVGWVRVLGRSRPSFAVVPYKRAIDGPASGLREMEEMQHANKAQRPIWFMCQVFLLLTFQLALKRKPNILVTPKKH